LNSLNEDELALFLREYTSDDDMHKLVQDTGKYSIDISSHNQKYKYQDVQEEEDPIQVGVTEEELE